MSGLRGSRSRCMRERKVIDLERVDQSESARTFEGGLWEGMIGVVVDDVLAMDAGCSGVAWRA